MREPETHIYEFGDFRLCAAKRLLLKGVDEIVPLMPKAFDTLLYLVQHNGKVIEKDELMREIWADTIVEENNLTQNISILRRVLGEKPGEHRFIVTVPGRGYKFVAQVIEGSKSEVQITELSEIPNSTFQIPVFSVRENKPETENRIAKDEKQETKIKNTSRFWLVVAFSAVVVGLILLGLYSWRENEKPAVSSIKSIAVLPFKPLPAENRNEALELGMADSLISKLSGVDEVAVRPLSAIRRYNSLEQDSLVAGRELNVGAVLDGTIQTSGERIRVSAKLLRTIDGKQMWAENFDEKFTDIFAVQDSITERVATALKIRLGGANNKRPTENVEAYELYMKGRYHSLNLTRPETDKGISYFRQAIELDPNYAQAYVGLAEVYLAMTLTSDLPSWEVLPKAKAAALRAVEIDETLAEAHSALGAVAFWYDWDWQTAGSQYGRALELNPKSAETHFHYAHLLSNLARHEHAIAEIKLSRELDPLLLRTGALEGQILFFAGRYDESLDRLNKTIDLNPSFWLSHLFLSRVYSEKGMQMEAIAAATKAKELSKVNSESIALIGYSQAKSSEMEKARALLDELLKLSTERYVPPYSFALLYNGLGENSKALDYLEKGFAEKDVRMVFLKVEPKWNNLRREPRFIDLIQKMNFDE